MPWLVGIDEAGYGPNLGPFVMSLVAAHVPARWVRTGLWGLLADSVCRADQETDGRLIVDDSKKVHTAHSGIARLETQVLPFQWQAGWTVPDLETYYQARCLTPLDVLQAEPWYAAGLPLPVQANADSVAKDHARIAEAFTECGVVVQPAVSAVVLPRQFNALLTQENSKSAVPLWALSHLLQRLPAPLDDDLILIQVDKLGGRNRYAAPLQAIFPEGLVMGREESAERSAYHVYSAARRIEIAFEPESDGRHFCVALASMASKYLREVLMELFNRFWQRHVPGLKPTAGYPTDAGRFYEDIRLARERLGIADEVLWRIR